jgi:hypothetical protein
MDTSPPTPRNRRERRAASKTNKTKSTTTSTSNTSSHLDTTLPEVPLVKPDYDAPRAPGHKTLYEIAAERQAELQKEGFYDKYNDKYAHGENAGDHQFWTSGPDDGEPPIGAIGEAFVWGISLSMLHFTLDVLVFHQYRQEVAWAEIWTRMFTMMPALFVVVYILHTRAALRWARLRQVFFFGSSVAAGCYLVKSGNKEGYYAVMKRAPPVGTLWVWGCVEMELWWAVAHVGVVGVYMWVNGFSAF